MKKILLVSTNTEKAPYPVPPIGICLLASFLNPLYEIRIYDGMFDEGKNLGSLISSFNPDFIGFSIRNVDNMVPERSVYYLENVIRNFIEPARKLTGVPFILGGSAFTLFPREIMEMTGADYGITGEGEETLEVLLRHLVTGLETNGIPGVWTRDGLKREHQRTGPELKMRQYSEIDLNLDFKPYTERGVYSIQTKRGCALRCVYCSYPLIEGRQYRLKTPDAVVNEISEAVQRLGENVTFEFVDSTFNEPQGHAEAICRELIRRKIRVKLRTMGVNPRNTGKELFGLMKEAGFMQIDVTPDSGSLPVIKNMRKGFTLEDIRRTAILVKEFDLPSMWFFLFGGPGENRETFNETLDFIHEYVNHEDLVYMAAGLRIYPGTPLHGIALKEGYITPETRLLTPPLFYFSKESRQSDLKGWITDASKECTNLLPSWEASPPADMVKEAVILRESSGLSEPMFRSLLRIRKEWRKNGKL